jgi:uncharacterized membrane protein
MTYEDARRQIVLLSLLTTVSFSCLIIISPLFIQLKTAEALQVVQIVFPVFAGYIGAAVLFLFRGKPTTAPVIDELLLRYLVNAPFLVFWCLGVAVLAYFYISNLPGHVDGMAFAELATYVTILISFMNATTGALIGFLFQSEEMAKTRATENLPSER